MWDRCILGYNFGEIPVLGVLKKDTSVIYRWKLLTRIRRLIQVSTKDGRLVRWSMPCYNQTEKEDG